MHTSIKYADPSHFLNNHLRIKTEHPEEPRGSQHCKTVLRTSIAHADAFDIAVLADPLQHLVHCHSVPLPDVLLHLHPETAKVRRPALSR